MKSGRAWIVLALARLAWAGGLPSSTAPMTAGLDHALIDEKADPCDDFYRFACGGWSTQAPIPPDRATFSRMSEMGRYRCAALN